MCASETERDGHTRDSRMSRQGGDRRTLQRTDGTSLQANLRSKFSKRSIEEETKHQCDALIKKASLIKSRATCCKDKTTASSRQTPTSVNVSVLHSSHGQ